MSDADKHAATVRRGILAGDHKGRYAAFSYLGRLGGDTL